MTSPRRRSRESTPSPTWSLTAEKADRTPVHAFSQTSRAGPSRSFNTRDHRRGRRELPRSVFDSRYARHAQSRRTGLAVAV